MMHHKLVLSMFLLCACLIMRIDLLQSQCNPDPVPTAICDVAPLACMAGNCYETGIPTSDPHNGWCGANTAIHNAQYFRLIATSSTTTVMISVNNCAGGGGCGLQCALIDTCNWDNADVLDCDPGTNVGGIMVLDYTGLQVGKAYWIVIDGCGGQICEYEFLTIEGFMQGPVTDVHLTACDSVVVFDGMEYSLGVHQIVYESQDPEVCDSTVHLTVSEQVIVEMVIPSYCELEIDTIEIGPVVSGVSGPFTFIWHDGITDSLRVFTDLTHGDMMSVTVTGSDGCAGSASIVIEGVIQSVQVFPAIGHLCPGTSFMSMFDFNIIGGTAPYLIQWILPGETIHIPIPPLLVEPGTHVILVTDANGCQVTGQFELIVEEVLEAAFDVITVGDSVYFENLSTNALSSEWNFGDGSISNVWNPNHQYASSGQYTVTLVVIGECGTDAETQVIQVTGVSTQNVASELDVLIVPNPNDGSFSILSGDCEVQPVGVYDWLGRQAPLDLLQGSGFCLSQRLPGVYSLIIMCDGTQVIRRMIVQ